MNTGPAEVNNQHPLRSIFRNFTYIFLKLEKHYNLIKFHSLIVGILLKSSGYWQVRFTS